MDILKLIQERQSSRVLFDPERKIPEPELQRILEAARWAPTAHNMQNFEVVVVDDRALLDQLSKVDNSTSVTFVEENYRLLSFSEVELKRKKVGLLGLMFPPEWRTPGVAPHVDPAHAHSILGAPIAMSSALLFVLFNPNKRAPASEGDVLGMMSLGCVMENMWLVAHSLGIGFQIQSTFSSSQLEQHVHRLLAIPETLRVGFAVRLGYPTSPPTYLRVRREVNEFTHCNRYCDKRST